MAITSTFATGTYSNALMAVSAQDLPMKQVLMRVGQTQATDSTSFSQDNAATSASNLDFAARLQEATSPVMATLQNTGSQDVVDPATNPILQAIALDRNANPIPTQNLGQPTSGTVSNADASSALQEQAYRSPLASSIQGPGLAPPEPHLPATDPVHATRAISGIGTFKGHQTGGQETFQQMEAKGIASNQDPAHRNYRVTQQQLSPEPSTGNLDVTA